MLEELQSDALNAAFISAAILVLFTTGELLHRRRGVRVELTRKLSHVGAGANGRADGRRPWWPRQSGRREG